MKKSFILYSDQLEMVNQLSDEQAGLLLKHIYQYSIKPEFNSIKDPAVKIAFTAIKTSIDRDTNKYLQRCEKNQENIRKRWNKKNTKDTTV